MKILSLFKDSLISNLGDVSSKRIMSFMTLLILLISYLIAQIWGKSAPEYMFEYLSYIVIAGMGFTSVEKFSKNKPNTLNNSTDGQN
jgi:positive regulator of sigma E activity